ncbi:RDD family protein [Streptomyces sp. SDr-06]|uniref:RDD family protein n=1 Tax=Streptomyces sp. SDr-06 TaxID=2267702 RepID=UPI000DE8478A|nr:RDD family protein [Streptomyces sp. SDr-06]RCH68369.1 RDD family protein [Streptomyces sp. SDr-06]
MATVPPDSGGSVAREGYYPDPSIPGYVRYWNGVSWVPGTSRPAPGPGEAQPAVPAGAAPAPAPALASAPPLQVPSAEETGPVFLDEPDPTPASTAQGQGARPQPAWHADAVHQSGFGGDQDRRVSWGQPVDPRGLPETADPRRLPDPRRPDPARPAGPVPHQQRSARPAGAVPPAAVEPPPARAQLPAPADPVHPAPLHPAPAERAAGPYATPAQAPAPAQPQPQAAPSQAQPSVPGSPMTAGPGGGAASWAQQVHQLARPDPQEPVVPWKPPVADPFLQAAQAQASARPAGLGRRLIARLVDSVLLGALVGGLAVPLVVQAADHIQEKIDAAKLSGQTVTVYLLDGTTAGLLGIVIGAFLVLGLLYEALPTAKWGRTLGKKLCGVQVRGIESYEPPTFGQAVRRWLVYGVLGLLAVGVVNVAWCLFDRPWRQCWHDKAARTFVAQG